MALISSSFAPKQKHSIHKYSSSQKTNTKITSKKTNKKISNKDNSQKSNKTRDENKQNNSNDNNEETQKSYAKTFGTKPVDELQKYVGVTYSSIQLSGNEMGYGYTVKNNGNQFTLIRVDNTISKITKVYLYDKNNPDIKNEKLLYTGQTIQQKNRNRYAYIY